MFTNLIDTDQVYGHRHDAEGFAGALRRIDDRVGGWLERLTTDDLLVLTADHGCDLTSPRTDHTRERTLLASFTGHGGRRLTQSSLTWARALAWLAGGARSTEFPGRSFL